MQEATLILSRVLQAKQFVQASHAAGDDQTGYWLAIGGVGQPWTDDSNPEYPDVTMTSLPGLHGMVYVNMCSLVYLKDTGGISTDHGNYAQVTSTMFNNNLELVNSRAYTAYISAEIRHETVATGVTYRRLGLCSDVVFNDSSILRTTGQYVLANKIDSYNLLWTASFSETALPYEKTSIIQLFRSF